MDIPDPENVDSVPEQTLDTRSDCEIIHQLRSFQEPTESNKNVWGYWHTGFDRMPPWTQRNVIQWARQFGPSWTVRIVDSVPGSPAHVSRFVPPTLFPDAFNSGGMIGRYIGAHSADLVRLPLLDLHGGIWMDVGTILIRPLDDLWELLQDPDVPYIMAAMTIPFRRDEAIMTNSFLASLRDNTFIRRWHQIFVKVWERTSSCVGAHSHPLLQHLPLYTPPGTEPNEPSLPSSAEEMSDYLAHMLCAERLRDLVDSTDGFSGRDFYENRIFLLPILKEGCYFQRQTGWNGVKQFELLRTKTDVPKKQRTDQFSHALAFVHDMLENTTMLKLGHGPKGVTTPWLADLWDQSQYQDADHEPGTFAAYLRNKSLTLRQKRPLEPLSASVDRKLWYASLLEPCTI
jgi:hypothetical protein